MTSQTGAIAQAGGLATLGIAAAPFIGPGAAFLIFGTAALQSFPGALNMDSQIDQEVQAREATCSQVKETANRINEYQELIDNINNYDITQITDKLTTINDTIDASNKKLKYVKERFQLELFVTIIIYIFVIVALAGIIILKKS